MTAIGVCGAGTMGAGIAQVAIAKGLRAVLYDPHSEALDKARSRIEAGLDKWRAKHLVEAGGELVSVQALEALAECRLVVEAVIEDLDSKRDLFRLLDSICPDALLATNTSSLSVTAIAGATSRPERVVGLHFFNPVPLMQLVEVIPGRKTNPQRVSEAVDWAKRLGKTPVVAKDTPAFIVNRIARPFYGEALRLLGEEAASVEEIDRIVRGAGFRMGPFELMDLIGLDINFAVTRSVHDAYFGEPRFRPHPIQRQMVEAGLLGRKAGEGFYVY